MSDSSTIFLGRQPILDRSKKLVAFELLFRSGKENAARVTDDTTATAIVITRAFSELGVEAALGDGLGFINCDARLLLSEAIEALPRDRIVLEILETVEPTPEILDRCRALRELGFTLALDDYAGAEDRYRELLSLVDFIKVDLKLLTREELAHVTERLKPLGVPLLAEKVDSQEEADHCMALGFEFFQGYFFARPTILQGHKLEQNQLSLLRLLALVMEDAETDALESAVKRDPGLAMNLLRLVNSVGVGARSPVHSLRNAITLLGRRQLQRWIQLLLFTKPGATDVANPLLQMAATRGRLMELLAGSSGNAQKSFQDESFMVGIMSLMPALLACSMEDILKPLPISPTLRDALLAQTGALGELLTLAISLEDADEEAFLAALSHFPLLTATQVFTAEATAMAWANQIGKTAED